jgi:hypothetical protein
MMTLTHADVRDLLIGLSAAIELDQIRVDALRANGFHPAYNDSMWRRCRRDHLNFIDRLLPTVTMISKALLRELSRIAVAYDPAGVHEVMVDLLSEAANGTCALEEVESAEKFFGWLVKNASLGVPGEPLAGNARSLMMQWVRVTDPLHIADDPECGYGRPSGFVN